jgi:hypothetical protein
MNPYVTLWVTLISIVAFFSATEPLFYQWLTLRTLRLQQWIWIEWLKYSKYKDPRTNFLSVWNEAQKNGDKWAEEYFPRD